MPRTIDCPGEIFEVTFQLRLLEIVAFGARSVIVKKGSEVGGVLLFFPLTDQ